MIVSSYPALLDHLRHVERCVPATYWRVRYRHRFAGKPFVCPALNGNSADNSSGHSSDSHGTTELLFVPFHAQGVPHA